MADVQIRPHSVQFEKGWAVGVDFLLSRAINVEGSGETRISSLVAEKILMFIERCNRSLEDYANLTSGGTLTLT